MKPALHTILTLATALLLGAVLVGCGQGRQSSEPTDAPAAKQPYSEFGDTRIYHSTFNSSFLEPQIAATYGIVRGDGKGLVNVSVIVDGEPSGTPATVSGTVTNLLGQLQSLDFSAVREGDSVYYLAPFNFTHEDQLTFNLEVNTDSDPTPHQIEFKRTMYRDM